MPRRPAAISVALHLAGLLVFLAVPFLMAPDADLEHPLRFGPGRSREIFGYACTIGYFYLAYYYLIPRVYFRRRYVLYTLLTVLCFAAVVVLPVWCFPFADGTAPDSVGPALRPAGPPGPLRHIEHNLFRFTVVFALAMLLRVSRRWRETEAARNAAELAALKAQLDPHFLFNTLNTVYALSVMQSAETPAAITHLSAMMRYLMEEAGGALVPLSREVAHLRDYLALQRLRLGHTAGLDAVLDEPPPSGLSIPPQLLLPLIENAFKHGVNPERPSPILIRLCFRGAALHLHVQNEKVLAGRGEARTGLGLGHTRRRLEAHYPGRHVLDIKETSTRFTLDLKIIL